MAREMLAGDHALFSGVMPGSVRLDRERTAYRKSVPMGRREMGRPEVWAWKVGGTGGRYAILFSPLDVTSGLLGTETWGICGYEPATAEGLARDMVLYGVGARGK